MLYSGGPRPYAGLGLGEVMVFVFFGLVATCGTSFVMVETVPANAWWCAAVLGLLAVAILEANNVRDIATDETAGKRTLAVRLGDARARRLYAGLVIGAFVTIVAGFLAYLVWPDAGLVQWGLFGLAAWPLAIKSLERRALPRERDLLPCSSERPPYTPRRACSWRSDWSWRRRWRDGPRRHLVRARPPWSTL